MALCRRTPLRSRSAAARGRARGSKALSAQKVRATSPAPRWARPDGGVANLATPCVLAGLCRAGGGGDGGAPGARDTAGTLRLGVGAPSGSTSMSLCELPRTTKQNIHDAPQPRRVRGPVQHEQTCAPRHVDWQAEQGRVNVLVDASLIQPEGWLPPRLLLKLSRPARQRHKLSVAVVAPRVADEGVDAAELDRRRGCAQIGGAERRTEVVSFECRPREAAKPASGGQHVRFDPRLTQRRAPIL
mmetsp:Transcript_24826/g.81228  ORF Transcript_24826/g.81228 Transcript_24826/m.81228 type:complete len:244 (+) Transcript_24826:252-983(+)